MWMLRPRVAGIDESGNVTNAVLVISASAGGDFVKPVPAVANSENGKLEMSMVVGTSASDRTILQGDAGGANDARNSIQLSSNLQNATLYGNPASSSDTFSITNLALIAENLYDLSFEFARNDGAGGTQITITNLGNSQSATSARLNWNGDVYSIGPAESYTSNPMASSILAILVEYQTDTRIYPLEEGQGDSYPLAEGERILWRNNVWFGRSKRRKVMGQGALSLNKRQTVFADRL